jgi:hypothetical protein
VVPWGFAVLLRVAVVGSVGVVEERRLGEMVLVVVRGVVVVVCGVVVIVVVVL